MSASPRIGVVGAGAAGTLTALCLANEAVVGRAEAEITLIDPSATDGRGVAYSTTDLRHRLNVPADRMSALVDDPEHFLRWVRRHVAPEAVGSDYLPRAWYGRYLADSLAEATAVSPARLVRRRDTAVAAHATGPNVRLSLATGDVLDVDSIVLAQGVAPPALQWAPLTLQRSGRLVPDPWSPGGLERIGPEDAVLLVGAGLTMVDVALTLAAPGRMLHAVSRTGLIPKAHAAVPVATYPAPVLPDGPLTLSHARRLVHDHVSAGTAATGDWRAGFDSLRAVTAQLWQRLSVADRTLFLRTDARTWDVHRHRMAPQVSEELDRLQADGRLSVIPGEVADVQAQEGDLMVTLTDGRELQVGWVVNCTGPLTDPAQRGDPLLDFLLATGDARVDPLRLGLDADPDGRVITAAGVPSPWLWAVGSARRGRLWESTAIPEIRRQAVAIAQSLLR